MLGPNLEEIILAQQLKLEREAASDATVSNDSEIVAAWEKSVNPTFL